MSHISIQGYPRLHSVGTLLISWILVCACLIRGIRSSGRVVYFTSFFPYAVLSALAIRGITMPGATDGIAFLFQPKWELLANPQIWTDAATQGQFRIYSIYWVRHVVVIWVGLKWILCASLILFGRPEVWLNRLNARKD